jgi:hypothetical protein
MSMSLVIVATAYFCTKSADEPDIIYIIGRGEKLYPAYYGKLYLDIILSPMIAPVKLDSDQTIA